LDINLISEDKTIKIWDMEKRTLIDTIKKDNERFWILSAHPQINILGKLIENK
jgi:coatomer protein complex subunit alpha (xenin)